VLDAEQQISPFPLRFSRDDKCYRFAPVETTMGVGCPRRADAGVLFAAVFYAAFGAVMLQTGR
jgi:hypothetical protein